MRKRKSASIVIDSIRCVLDELALLDKKVSQQLDQFSTKKLRYSLKNLQIFALCARKLERDVELRSYGRNHTPGSLLERIADMVDSISSSSLSKGLLGKKVSLQLDQFSTKKLRNHSPGSLLKRIADMVDRNQRKIRPYCVGLGGGSDFQVQIIHFEDEIQTFDREIDRWYTYFLDPLRLPVSPTPDEVKEITTLPDFRQQPISLELGDEIQVIDSVSENLVVYLSSKFQYLTHSPEAIEALLEKLTFLRNFIHFVLRSIDQWQMINFWDHVEAVAVNAAHLCYMTQCDFNHDEWRNRMQNINANDPRVHQSYIETLTSTRLSRPSYFPIPTLEMDRDPTTVMKDFIDFLMWNIWEMLKTNTSLVISSKSRLQLLHEGLRFLRIILNKRQDKFDVDIQERTRLVICDAGLIIFSLHQKGVKIFVSLSDLLRRIKFIRKEVEGKDPDKAMFYFPRTSELAFFVSLLENLEELTSWRTNSLFQSQFQTIHLRLLSLKSFMKTVAEVRSEQEELEDLWNSVMEVAHRVENLLDQYVRARFIVSSLRSFDSRADDIISKIETLRVVILMDQSRLGGFGGPFSSSVDSIPGDNIRKIETVALNIGRREGRKLDKVSKTSNFVPSQSSGPILDDIVGFGDDIASIINRLKRGSKQLKMVAIMGMPGIGKTTLATKVFKDPSITRHFHLCIQCCVSQLLDKKKVLLELFNNITPSGNLEMAEQDLAENLWHHLKGKRYLIFLDDIWDITAWNCLKGSFPDDSQGSRILLTSRHRDAAPQDMLDEEPHFLRLLTIDESLELLQRKLFPGTYWPPALYELGKQVAKNCEGLPLKIVVVAGLLANLEIEGWKKVLESLSSGIISSTEHCMKAVDLSYSHLPEYLRPCFLYFGMFPEDQEVSVQRLLWLWIAEGFIKKTELKSLEDVASDYMKDLVGRNLVIVSKKRSRGGVKACRMHDLLHDFCRTRAREEKFFQLLKGYDELISFHEPFYLQRLSIHSQKKHFKDLRLFSPRVHSLLFFIHNEPWSIRGHDISFIIPIYKHLMVLDIGQFNLGPGFPIEIHFLVQLRYLAVRGDIGDIPSSSIENLSKLETLVVESTKMVSLPDTIWDLQNLRHLHMPNGFHMPIGNLDNSSVLNELESCSGAFFYSWNSMQKLLGKFPNIRKLKCRVFQRWDTENCNEILVPDFLSQLESLDITPSFYPAWYGVPSYFQYEFGFHKNLKKLTLNYFKLPHSKISTIGELPNLEVLKLLEDNWDILEGEFSRLRFLQLSYWDIVRWTAASDDEFPPLEKLVLEGCRRLEEIPSFLEDSPTLEMIEVRGCSDYVARSVQRIQDVQKDMGNLALKILISHHSSESSW